MLLRRCIARPTSGLLAAAAPSSAANVRWASSKAVATTPDESESVAVASSSTTSTAAVASSSSSSKKGAFVTATTLHAGDAPKTIKIDLSTPDENAAPPRLESYTEPKPFITPRQARNFTFSAVVGVSVIAAVHFILSASIAENYEEELAVLRRVTKDSSAAEALAPKPEIPQFVAPSSYSALKKRMEEEAKISREAFLHDKNVREAPVLHQEVSQRLMLGWNAALANVEQSAAAMAVQYHNWRLKQMKKNVRAIVEEQQLTLVELREVA